MANSHLTCGNQADQVKVVLGETKAFGANSVDPVLVRRLHTDNLPRTTSPLNRTTVPAADSLTVLVSLEVNLQSVTQIDDVNRTLLLNDCPETLHHNRVYLWGEPISI